MINIPKQLWYVVKPSEKDNLAYMTYYENNAAFEKRKSTGFSWAGTGKYNYTTREYEKFNVIEKIIDNTPTQGIYIGSSVSRWSTSNKLFRVQDPRGFTVEVPTDNIATLLHLTTVKNGVVQEPCVWGREGSNHILLPVNSEPYLDTLDKMDTLANKLIKVSELQVGDVVTLFEDDTEYTFLGIGKVTWKLTPYTQYWYMGWNREYGTPVLVKDIKWEPVFSYEYKYSRSDGDKHRFDTKNNPKITKVVNQGVDVTELRSKLELWAPQRIRSKVDSSCEHKIESVEWK